MHYLRWVAGCALIAACGTSKPATPPVAAGPSAPRVEAVPAVHERGGQKLTARVGSAGGTLELDNGARLDIPQGALDEPIEITFATGARTTAFSNREFERPVGPTLEIAPELAPSSPLVVSIPLTQLPEGFAPEHLTLGIELPSSTQRAVQGQSTQTRWDYGEAQSQGSRATASLAQVPGYRVQFVVSKSD